MADYYLQIKKECICFKYFFHKRRPIVRSSFKRHSEKVLIYCGHNWIKKQRKKPRKVLAFLKVER